MPRYKLHVLNDTFYEADEEGIALPDAEAMKTHAVEVITGIIKDELKLGHSPIHLAVMVDGENGERVANFRSTTTLVYSSSPFAEPEGSMGI